MAAQILSGRILAETARRAIAAEVAVLRRSTDALRLTAVCVGDNEESERYMQQQRRAAEAVGIDYERRSCPADITEPSLRELLQELNRDHQVQGVILQMPLPPHLDNKRVGNFIDPLKDVEGIHSQNLGKLILNRQTIAPCTAGAVVELLESTGVDLYGKEAVIIGHSEIVGKPIAVMLLNRHVTTTVCHIATSRKGNLETHVRRAEILVVAVGKAGLIPGSWIRPGAIVIDVGINCVDGKVVGDVEFETAQRYAAFITPVPGGVGPLTVAMLMKNFVRAVQLQQTSG